jgi:hypothetical protein
MRTPTRLQTSRLSFNVYLVLSSLSIVISHPTHLHRLNSQSSLPTAPTMSSFAALPSLPSLDLPSIPFSFAVPPSYDHPSISSNSSNNHHGHPSGDLRGSGAGGGAGVHHHHHPHARRWARPTARVLASSLAASTSAGSIRASDMGRGSRAWAEANARGGIARALEGRGPLGTDLVLEERDLSDEEAEFDLKVRSFVRSVVVISRQVS